MKHIEIWMEGYAITGQYGIAQCIWRGEAKDFNDAVKKYYKDKDDSLHRYENGKHSIWGCRLFDNEQDAREGFG